LRARYAAFAAAFVKVSVLRIKRDEVDGGLAQLSRRVAPKRHFDLKTFSD
jgi:hypothetical protein